MGVYMKRRLYKSLALLLVVFNIFFLSANAEHITNARQNILIAENDEGITPYLTYLSMVSCHMEISDGQANFYGIGAMYRNQKLKLELSLQRSTDNTNWLPVKNAYWTRIWYSNGTYTLTNAVSNLPKGYFYRACTAASALSASNVSLETVILYSQVIYY